MFHTSCSFWTSWNILLISVCEKHLFSRLHSCYLCPFFQLITADAGCFWQNTWYVQITITVGILLCMVILCKWKIMNNLGIITTVNSIMITLYSRGCQQSPRKFMEPIVFVHSCEKPQQFGLIEWINFRWLTVTARFSVHEFISMTELLHLILLLLISVYTHPYNWVPDTTFCFVVLNEILPWSLKLSNNLSRNPEVFVHDNFA